MTEYKSSASKTTRAMKMIRSVFICETTSWYSQLIHVFFVYFQNTIQQLKFQIDTFDYEVENLQAGSKKKKVDRDVSNEVVSQFISATC